MRNLTDELNSYFDETEVSSIEIGLGEKLARGRHANYDEIVGPVFHQMADDSELRRRLLSQTDLAESIYQHGVNETDG